MPNPERVHRTNLNKNNFNLIIFFNLCLAFAGSIFLAWKKVDAGIIYTLMFLGIIALISLIMLFLKDDDSLKPITDYVKIPIATKLPLAAFFYLIAIALPMVIHGILKISGSSYNIVQLSTPLFGQQIHQAYQSFSTAEIGSSMPWKIFNTMYVAGNIETFTFNFGLVLVGVLLGWFTLKLINDVNDIGFISKKFFIVTYALAVSLLGFVLSHMMNGSYGPKEFIIAGIFLLVSNISIYLGGFFLAFWAGYHQSNNLLFLITVDGLKTVVEGFISWFGLIFVIYHLLILFYVIRHWDDVKREFFNWLGW